MGRLMLGVVAGVVALGAGLPVRAQGQAPPPVPSTAGPPPAPTGAEPPAPSPPALGEEDAMVLNFERADIREVIHSLATALGLSYTIDPRIEGQVTIRTTGKIAREDLFPLFNQILRNNGIAAVKVGDLYQILPVSEAKTRAIIPKNVAARQGAREEDTFVIEIVPLKHVSADEMSNILQPFLTPGGDVLSYARANVVVITDLADNVERLKGLVTTFDTDTFRNLHARVFKMRHGDPDELANELLGVLAPYGITATGEGAGGTFLIPLSRLNAIVVISYDMAIFEEVGRWLRLLDIPPDEESGRQTFVYNVENAKAADLAAVLNELFGGGPGGGPGGFGPNPGAAPAGVGLFGAGGVSGGAGRGGAFGAGARPGGGFGGGAGGGLGGGGLGGGGAGGLGGGIGQQAGGLGTGGGPGGGFGGAGRPGGTSLGGGTRGGPGGAAGAPGQPGAGGARGVSFAGGAAATTGVPGGPPPIFKQEVRIVADDVTNSLVILATKRDYNLIRDVMRRIDVVPRQVVLEVTIAEVDLTKDLQFGIAWAVADGKLNGGVLANQGLFNNSGVNVLGLNPNTARIPAAGAFAILTDQRNFQIFINALQSRTNVKMLSAPHIIAADNREAHILIGQSIPILTASSQSTLVGSANIINSVQYRDTGKILTILPQVNSKGLVNMQVRQEVSAVAAATFGTTGSPSFNTREAETTLVVQDGDTVLIGGIIDDTVEHDRTGFPYLMDMPFLGFLFRTDTDNVMRTELIITITPYVMRNRDESTQVTDEFSDRILGLKRMQEALHIRHKQRFEPPETEPPPPPKSPEKPMPPGGFEP